MYVDAAKEAKKRAAEIEKLLTDDEECWGLRLDTLFHCLLMDVDSSNRELRRALGDELDQVSRSILGKYPGQPETWRLWNAGQLAAITSLLTYRLAGEEVRAFKAATWERVVFHEQWVTVLSELFEELARVLTSNGDRSHLFYELKMRQQVEVRKISDMMFTRFVRLTDDLGEIRPFGESKTLMADVFRYHTAEVLGDVDALYRELQTQEKMKLIVIGLRGAAKQLRALPPPLAAQIVQVMATSQDWRRGYDDGLAELLGTSQKLVQRELSLLYRAGFVDSRVCEREGDVSYELSSTGLQAYKQKVGEV